MFRILIFFAIIFSESSCKKPAASPAKTDTDTISTSGVDTNSAGNQRFLALGDSYSIGQSVSIEARFPHQTVESLNEAGYHFLTPDYIAATGWPTESLISAIDNHFFTFNYDVVSLLIGVNDQYLRHDTSGYRDRFRELVNRSIERTGNRRNHVFVLSIPDYSVTAFASGSDTAMIRIQIDQFNFINFQESLAAGVNYLDITQSSREAANNPDLLASDGLHPSGIEYRKWAIRLAAQIQTVIH